MPEVEASAFSLEAFDQRAQSALDLREAKGTMPEDVDMHAFILARERDESPLSSDLCGVYERGMVARINRRQRNNNVPIVVPI